MMGRNQFRIAGVCTLWLLTFLLRPGFACGAIETVILPITLDYALVRTFFCQQSYTLPDERAVILEDDQGCTRIELRDPQVAAADSLIKVTNHVKVSLATPLLGTCRGMEWEGYLEVMQKVTLNPDNSRLEFETVNSAVYTENREPATLITPLWDLVQAHALPFLDRMTIDLAPPVQELKDVLPLFFSAGDKDRIGQWLDTLRLEHLRIDPDAVRLDVLLDVEPMPQPEEAVKEISSEEIERLAKTWEDWDAYLVYEIQSLIGKPLTDDEKGELLETLLEIRYGFLKALTEKTIGPHFINEQFIWTWQRLAAILKKYLVAQISESPLNYLAFFTATDALAALQKLGPTLGLDISLDGLVRLGSFLSEGRIEPLLEYSYEINPDLRTLLGFGPPLTDTGPAFEVEELDNPDEDETDRIFKPVRFRLDFWSSSAYAGDAPPKSIKSILPWVPRRDSLKPYLDRVKQVIEKAATETLKKNNLEGKDQSYFRLLSLATAWQESCWRQFITKGGKVRYLVSYNNTSVGLMQVNERVWRGMYRLQSLRWNIEYNARAGSEILQQYLQKYAIRKMDVKNTLDSDTLVRVVYAMYNGGPGEFKKYFKRKQAKSYYKSDKLFWEKYLLTKKGRFDKVLDCY